MRVGGCFRYESSINHIHRTGKIQHRKGTEIQNYDVRKNGQSYRYDSAHIPAKAEAASPSNRAVIRSKDAIIRQCYK